jgi:hypothetical protein
MNIRLHSLTRAATRGQSTIEFVVVMSFAGALLFIAVPLIGQYIDINQTAEEASRYAAFEGMARNSRSTWKNDTDLSAEVRRRMFSNSDAPVKTGDVAGDFTANRNPVWTDYSGHPLISNFDNEVSVTTKVDDKNAIAAAFYRGELNLSNTNFYTASVTVKPEDSPFAAMNLSISRKTVLLADAWTGFNVGDVQHRIETAPTMFPIGPAKALINTLGEVPTLIFDPALKVGAMDWDIVPCDRLVGGC